ncbi:MAG: thymidine phosphorylase, partial [Nitratireductor sp.]
IDLSVGLTDFRQVGDAVGPDRPLCTIHARSEAEWETAAARVRAAVQIADTQPEALGPIVIERIARSP